MDASPRRERIVPVAASISALILSIVTGGFVLVTAFMITGYERYVSGHTSGWVEAVAVVLLCPSLAMGAGSILMLRRRNFGRVVVAVIALFGTVTVGLIAAAQAVDGEIAVAVRVAAVAAAPGVVLILSTNRASKKWTERTQGRRPK
ncbi:hypothetical protein [Nocardia sp. NPDC058666]|uniref:hypothetical protein n=1 Tax=unclassified Nocardia TaxID=2637762 RepID=UPI0036624894